MFGSFINNRLESNRTKRNESGRNIHKKINLSSFFLDIKYGNGQNVIFHCVEALLKINGNDKNYTCQITL